MKLAAHGWMLHLLPDLGGAVAALERHGHAVLRGSPTDLSSPLDSACFPLVPYANRIASGRFILDGTLHQLPLNFGDHPHSLHGFGWQMPWQVVNHDGARVTLEHHHHGCQGWPWPYRACQEFVLDQECFTLILSITNAGDQPMPAGLGLHPYFPCDETTKLTARSSALWLADETMLPSKATNAEHFGDWAHGNAVQGQSLIDNAYPGWDGQATITQRWGKLRLDAPGVDLFHLFRPPHADFFCLEPVTHLPDAINNTGMSMLSAGQSLTIELKITASVGMGVVRPMWQCRRRNASRPA